MKEKLCLALALSQTEALFPGRFRSRESGLIQHWRLNAPPKPSIFIPRDGVLDDRNVFIIMKYFSAQIFARITND